MSTGQTLLAAAQQAGVALVAVCGGSGLCQECRVRVERGRLTPLTLIEEAAFTQEELNQGYRLACQAEPLSDVKLEIPPESLSAVQRLQVEGQQVTLDLNPIVTPLDLELPRPGLDDLRADSVRLRDTLASANAPACSLELPVMVQFSERMRSQNWKARLARHRNGNVVSVLPYQDHIYGFAVDIGTTKVAAYLVDLESGHTVAKQGAMNPQISYGEDVVARIAYANQGSGHRKTLQSRVVDTLNTLLRDLRIEANVQMEQVVDAVVVGNTAMHHLFAGLPVTQLGEAPYVAAVTEPLDLPAREIGLELAPGAFVHLPPNIAGYVGADHVSMLLATRAWQQPGVTIALDIGTNTEISLTHKGRILSCSCASGPAFEGAHISAGMRAAPGAIERVQIKQNELLLATIDHKAPVGICGSGILDAVAEMLSNDIIESRGVLRKNAPGVVLKDRGAAFMLVPAADSGNGSDILVTRKDVNEIQLAKAAIRGGVEILLLDAGLKYQDIDNFIVAGAFGTYISLPNAVKVGMFPDLPADHFHQVGNAAGIGACQMLVSRQMREEALGILNTAEYIELTTHPAFADIFVRAISFEPF